jgi:hypothetical protein
VTGNLIALLNVTIVFVKARDAAPNITAYVQDPIVTIGGLGPPEASPEVCFELRRRAGNLRCRVCRRRTGRIESAHGLESIANYERAKSCTH